MNGGASICMHPTAPNYYPFNWTLLLQVFPSLFLFFLFSCFFTPLSFSVYLLFYCVSIYSQMYKKFLHRRLRSHVFWYGLGLLYDHIHQILQLCFMVFFKFWCIFIFFIKCDSIKLIYLYIISKNIYIYIYTWAWRVLIYIVKVLIFLFI